MTFTVSHLSNKLPVVSYHMPSFKTVAINYIVGVGSRYETKDQEGLSHFLEHMAFKGTKTRSAKNIAEEFDEIGGHFNAYTSKEHTVYYAKVLDNHAEKAMEIMSDIILNSTYEQKEIDKEYSVICQEIAQTNDNPDDICYENLVSVAFPDQPLGKSILGTPESIAKFKTASFQNYVSNFYTNKNSLISVAGNIDHGAFAQLAEKGFGSIGSQESIKPTDSSYQGGTIYKTKDLEQTTFYLGFKSPSYMNTDLYYHTQMLSLILGGGISSKLFQSIRENLGLAYSVGSFNAAYQDNAILSLYASCDHDKTGKVIDQMLVEVNKIISKVDESDLRRAKEQLRSCVLMSEEKTASKSQEVGKSYFIFGREIPTTEILERIERTSILDIKNIAENVFSQDPVLSAIGQKLPELTINDIKARL